MTTETPTATAAVAPEPPFFRPSARAIVPATPTMSAESVAESFTEPLELVTCRAPPLAEIELAMVPSILFTAAEPAPAIEPVPPVPRATDAATPTARVETFPCAEASSVTSLLASTVDPSILASTVLSMSLMAMPTPIASAPVVLFGRREAAYAIATPKASARSS